MVSIRLYNTLIMYYKRADISRDKEKGVKDMDKALRSLELTTPQYAVLAQLELKPGISNAALARSAFIMVSSLI
jgi:DNA-binding MarR family transcriptional regulator